MTAPHFSQADLVSLDERIEAQLDGLRLAGDEGWRAAERELHWEEPGEHFTAAVLAFESGDRHRIDRVLQAARGSHDISRGVVSAIGWLSDEPAMGAIELLLRSSAATDRRIGIAGAAVRRHDPGEALAAAIRDEDIALRVRALRAAGQLGRGDLRSRVAAEARSEHPDVRFWAAWSGSLLGESGSVGVLRETVEAGAENSRRGAELAARCLPVDSARDWVRRLAAGAAPSPIAIAAAGSLGDPALVPWLIEAAADPEHARAAGESFTLVTGVDLEAQRLDRPRPDGFEPGPSDDPDDDDTSLDREEHLPWPDPERLRDWWTRHGAGYRPGTRHLLGRPMGEDWLRYVLEAGFQRQRAAAALELALSAPEAVLPEVRARERRKDVSSA